MLLLIIAPADFSPLAALQHEPGDLSVAVGTTLDELRPHAPLADAVLIAPRYGSILRELLPSLHTARWIHTLAAGVESLPFDLLRRTPVVVTNSRGLYADALGEFAIAAMLWFAKDLRQLVTNQMGGKWAPYDVERLEGKTAGIIGHGAIGEAVARRATAMGMNIVSVRRRQEFGDPTIDDVVAEADYVVMSAPLTAATRGLMTRARIAAMKSNAVFINIGRGATVDEEALVEALRERRIRGAALDVFATEPLPPDHELWQLDNVLVSPHSADHTSDAHDRAMTFFLENLRRFRNGDSLENVVDKDEGY
jgi:phosphoglycerate dehydrogenase-like enzyme